MTNKQQGGTARGPDAGVLVDLLRKSKLVWRLMADRRVALVAKLVIPALMGLYLLWPVDLLPDVLPFVGQLDDLAMLALAVKVFLDLAPADVVAEHMGRQDRKSEGSGGAQDDSPIIDADYRVVD